jgi:hypothetical protein
LNVKIYIVRFNSSLSTRHDHKILPNASIKAGRGIYPGPLFISALQEQSQGRVELAQRDIFVDMLAFIVALINRNATYNTPSK